MDGRKEFTISNAIVNNDLVFSMGMNATELSADHSKFSNEYVAYMIIESAYKSIDSGNLVEYTMDVHH